MRIRKIHQRVVIALAAIASTGLCAASAFAKLPESAATGALDGKLTDTHSVPLAQAVVIVKNLATGATARVVTGKNGSYRFIGLGPGEYSLEAEVPELGKGAVDGIFVSAGHATRVQAALIMAISNPSSPVEAELHELDPVAAAVTTIIPSEELSAIPAASRDWQEFAAITPAANPASQSASNSGGQIGNQPESGDLPQHESLSIEGSSAWQTAGSIDGIQSAPAFHVPSDRQSRQTEAVGESAVFNMEARTGNSPADQGRSEAGTIHLTTNHGGNGLHGQAFYLNRQNFLNAQNPFTQWIQQTIPASGVETAQFTAEPYTPANSRQILGLGIGSQLKYDKLFWFAAIDGLLSNDPAVATVRHPTDFFAQPTLDDLTMLAARLDLPGPALLENAAANYSGWLTQMDGLLGPVPRTSSQWQGFARVDWQLTERQHLSTEGNAATVNAPAGALSRTSETYGSHSFGNSQATDTWGLAKLDSFLTPNLLNTFSSLYRRNLQSDSPQSPSAFEAPLLANAWGQLPEIVADSEDGFILGKPGRLSKSSYPDERALVAQDTVSWVRGAHLVKAGVSFDHISDYVGALVNQTGTYSYANLLNFITDTASFLKYGLTGVDNPYATQHNCDATGRVYTIAGDGIGGLGYLPCYAWYSQRIGPSNWRLSTNDLATFVTEQWQPLHNLTLSAGIRMEAEQLPPPIAATENPELPATEKLPPMTLNWSPRFGLAYSPWKSTVVRLGAGLYYGRIDNSVALAALTQTGSVYGDLNFFFRPTDTGAPAFPYVFPVAPTTSVTPGAVSFAPNFRVQEVDQAIFSIEQELPSHWIVTASALASLGRHLPISIDTNLAPAVTSPGTPQTITYAVVDALQAGPIKSQQITVPFYTARSNTGYQQLSSIESRANSTYDAAMFKIARYGGHGISLHAHYLYAHATDWNPNESDQVAVNDILDPTDFRLEYGTSNLDIRHSAAATVLYETPWKLHNWAGTLANGWSVAAIGQFRSGLPFTMRTGGYIPGFYNDLGQLLEGVGPSINGTGGDNRLYGSIAGQTSFEIGRNTYRYPATWTADSRLGKRFFLPHRRELELLAESYNLFNHQNVTLLETTGYTIERGTTAGDPPTLNFLTGLTSAGLPSTTPEFGKPLDVNATNFYHPREFQLGLRARF
jgi:hypothetical protein